jgi:hypothetical protein
MIVGPFLDQACAGDAELRAGLDDHEKIVAIEPRAD